MGNFIARAFMSFTSAKTMLPVIEKVYQIRGIVRESYEQESERTLGNSNRILLISPPNKGEDDEGFSIAYKEWLTLVGVEDFIDCNLYANGDEDLAVKLFLTLAEMRDNPLRDWNVSVKGDLFNPQKSWVSGKSRLATPLELAEAVMRGDVKL